MQNWPKLLKTMSIDGLPIEHQYQNRASLQKILRFIYKKHDTGTE